MKVERMNGSVKKEKIEKKEDKGKEKERRKYKERMEE